MKKIIAIIAISITAAACTTTNTGPGVVRYAAKCDETTGVKTLFVDTHQWAYVCNDGFKKTITPIKS